MHGSLQDLSGMRFDGAVVLLSRGVAKQYDVA